MSLHIKTLEQEASNGSPNKGTLILDPGSNFLHHGVQWIHLGMDQLKELHRIIESNISRVGMRQYVKLATCNPGTVYS